MPHTIPARRSSSSIVRLLLACLMLAWAGAVAAADAPTSTADTDATLDRMRTQIDAMQKRLQGNILDADLLQIRSAAQAAQTQATQIATSLAPQLDSVKTRLAQLGAPTPGTKEDPDITSQRAQLTKTSNAVDGQIKLANLLAVEGDQIAAQAWSLRRSQFQARLGERTTSILSKSFWSELAADTPSIATRLATLGKEIGDAAKRTPAWVWIGTVIGLVLVFGARWWAENRAVPWIVARVPATRLRRSLFALGVLGLWTVAIGGCAVALRNAVDWTGALSQQTSDLLDSFAGALWFGGYMVGVLDAIISADRPSWRLGPLPDSVARSMRRFPGVLATVAMASWLVEHLATYVNAGLEVTVAVNCLVALALALTLGLAFLRREHQWQLELKREGARRRPLWMAIVVSVTWLVLIASMVCLLGGWVAFGNFAIKQLLWTGIVVASTYLYGATIDDALMTWLGTRHTEGDVPVEAPIGLLMRARDQAAVLLSALFRLALLMVALSLLLAPFAEGPSDLIRRSGELQQGFSIGEIQLRPGAVLQALFVLGGGVIVVRAARRWLAKRYLPTTTLDPGMQQSTVTLFSYFGMVAAFALALSAMGIGLERVAWVASALSVGIGFGLQAVVQNFVSGLILLAERPVKVGDWVSLSGIEGDIRRINVRATEIQMGDRSTVIVPNSEFITKIVRNVTMADAMGLVQLKLPVRPNVDADRVRELMLASFQAHGDLLKTPAPSVLLDGIDAAGNLVFNATGYVASPRLAYGVRSALLFDILKRLREADITLAPPPTMLLGKWPEGGGAPLMPPAAPNLTPP
ncbi:MAG: mechanosensitive ion channel family protein [Proteobacteria bacterium]|nr:mechanosensitive ion channel family protein [Pseudomonadota bacterium]